MKKRSDLNGRALRGTARLCIVLAVSSASVLFSGCAFNKPLVITEERGTNGIVTIKRTSSITFALWPATSLLERQKLGNGRTQSIGTDGLEQQGGGTNMVEALKALDSILGKIKP